MKHRQIIAILALLVGSTPLMADKYDGSVPLLCAVTQTVGCDAVGDCVQGPADAVNLPIFLKFDIAKKEVISAKTADDRRTSTIESINKGDKVLTLTGFEPAGSWSAAIDKTNGKMSVSAAVNGHGYLIFGSCLAL
jgi:hypothetical protein